MRPRTKHNAKRNTSPRNRPRLVEIYLYTVFPLMIAVISGILVVTAPPESSTAENILTFAEVLAWVTLLLGCYRLIFKQKKEYTIRKDKTSRGTFEVNTKDAEEEVHKLTLETDDIFFTNQKYILLTISHV